MDKLLKKIKCWVFGHQYRLEKKYSNNVQKLNCKRCGEKFGINHDVRAVLPWDQELEDLMKLIHPDK